MVRREDANPGSDREAHAGKPVVRVDWLEGGMLPFLPDGDTALAWLRGDHARPKGRINVRGVHHWQKDGYGTLVGHALERVDANGVVEPSRAWLILKGNGLMALRDDDELCDRNVIHRFANWGGKVSRLDLAVDVLHPGVTPGALRKLWPRSWQTRMELGHDTEPKDPRKGRTFYLVAKDQRLRWYDKSAERRVHKGAPLPDGITRGELELRGVWARRAMRDLLAIPEDRWREDFPALVIGLILGKARPLSARHPGRNVQRVPTWQPMLEATAGAVPARLSKAELNRSAHQRAFNYARQIRDGQQAIALMHRLGLSAQLEQLRARTQLTPENEIVALAMTSDEAALRATAEALLAHAASPPRVKPDTPPLFDPGSGDDGAA